MISILVVITSAITQVRWADEIRLDPPTRAPSVIIPEDPSHGVADSAVPLSSDFSPTARAVSPATALESTRRVSARSGSLVRQASGVESVTPLSRYESTASSAEMVQSALEAAKEDPNQHGPTVTLLDVLQAHSHKTDRLRVVSAYWNVSMQLMRFHFAERHVAELAHVTVQYPEDGEIIRASLAAASAESARIRVALVRAQHQLIRTADLSIGKKTNYLLPLPGDVPWTGRYDTKFDAIFEQRKPPRHVIEIHHSIDPSQELIESLAAAVRAATRMFAATVVEYQQGDMTVGDLLRSERELAAHREQFVTTVIRYNQDIAEYALAVASPRVKPAKIVAMLVTSRKQRTPPTATRLRAASLHAPARDEQPNRLRRVPDNESIPLQPVPGR